MCTAQGKKLTGGTVPEMLVTFARLPESERKPGLASIGKRGPFDPKKLPLKLPANGMILKVFQRTLVGDGPDKLSAPEKMDLGGGNWVPTEPERDFVWLTEAEWKSLVPDQPRKGDKVPVPRAIQRRIFRYHLTDSPVGLSIAWEPSDVREGSLVLTVVDVSADGIQLELDGAVLLADHPDPAKAKRSAHFRLLGMLKYNNKQRNFDRVDIVAIRDASPGKPGDKPGSPRTTLGIAFELTRGESPADRRPPRGTWIDIDRNRGQQDYFRAD